jgi:hypothetical protein
MLFPVQNLRAYSRSYVEALPPSQMGCYGLYTSGAWVYIGKGDIRARLLAHLNSNNSCITRAAATGFAFVVTQNYDAEEVRLLAGARTLCNKKVVKPQPMPVPSNRPGKRQK